MIMDNNPREREEREEIFKNRIMYSLPVRAGYWLDELAQQEQNQYLYNYKREHCQLLVQKTRKMFRNLLRPVTLCLPTAYVGYGENYQVKALKVASNQNPCGKETLCPLYLSCLINEKEVDYIQHFIHGCGLTVSPSSLPCVRNVFQFVNCDSKAQGGNIAYGEDVYIKVVEGSDSDLYIQYENATVQTIGVTVSIRLTQNPDIYCRFKIFHWRPQMRYETTGSLVDQDGYVIIQHAASGHNLAAEFQTWLPTLFGPEYAVTCRTYRDCHKMETPQNLWRISGKQKAHFDLVQASKGDEPKDE